MDASGKNSSGDELNSSAGIREGRLPPLKALLAFEAAFRQGSFARGAEELSVTPSAVSHHIQQLEQFLGVPLFTRHAGRVIPTNAGCAYAKEVEHAFKIISGATKLVAPQSQPRHLAIACGPSFAAKWLQPRLPAFIQSHPSITIRLSTLSDRDALETSRFDVAVAYGLPSLADLRAEPLLVERLRPLCSPRLAIKAGLRVPRDLSRVTLIHSANALTWTDYLRRIGEDGLRPHGELWLDRSTMAIDAAVDDLGVVLESELLAADELRDGRLVTPFGDHAFDVETTTYFLVKPRRIDSNALSGEFEKWLRGRIAAANMTARLSQH